MASIIENNEQQQQQQSLQSSSSSSQQLQLLSPIFIDEPPARMLFSNSTGTVISCSATSSISPVKIWWINADNQAIVQEITGIRYVRPNGQLVFPPFALDQYRQDVHSTTYRCMASNTFATIRSRDCQLRAVVHQSFKLQVYDEFVIKENMAIMRCHIPSIVRDYVRIVAWLRDDHILVTASHNPHAGRYTLLSTGELLIHNTTFQDSGFYRCQIRHQLTDELRTSDESGRLIVTEPHNGVAPRIWTHTTVICDLNTICELVCIAQSWPLSSYRWYRETETGVYMAANLYDVDIDDGGGGGNTGNGYRMIFRPTTASHNGQWICMANNSLAEEKAVIRVQVRSPLQVMIEPRQQIQVDAGRPITFNCTAIGGPPNRQPSWYFNGKNMLNIFREHVRDQRIRLIEPNILHISAVRRQDVGAYQCVIQSEQDESQSIVELKLGDVAPMLLETFSERQVVESNAAISIRCVVIGTPLPQIRWYLDGHPIPPNLSRFRTGDHVTNEGKVVSFVNITNIRVIDGGQYTCVAENEVGRASFDGLVLVNGGPNLRTSFWNHQRHHNVSVVANMDAIIRCPIIGYPLESIQWEHNNNILPVNHRQSIEPIIDGYGGILRIESAHSFQDSGDYICTVRMANTATATATGIDQSGNHRSQQQHSTLLKGNVQLNVHYAPKIDRHSLPGHLKTKQGDRIKLMCSVIEGDQPIEIEWFRGMAMMMKAVRPSDQISIQNGDEYSLLTFKNVAITDSDKWTCRARNAYASDNSTIEIIVNVPPKWIHEPKNVQVILGRSLTINCQAEGYPKPKIVWKKAMTTISTSNVINNELINTNNFDQQLQQQHKTNNDFRDILSSYRYQVFSNGSLYLQETEITDTGLYMCQISNGIGTDLSKVIQIQVQQPPHVEQKFITETVIKGQTAILQCRSDGDPILMAEWKRDMQSIQLPQQQSNQHYVIKEDQSQSRTSIISYLEILDTNRLDSALFTCTISNPYGTDICNIQLIVQEVPEPPRDVAVSEITSRSVKIKWKPSFAGNSAIIGFIVQFKAKCFHDHLHHHNHQSSINNNNDNTVIIDKRTIDDVTSSASASAAATTTTNINGQTWKELYINDANLQSFVLRELYPWCSYELQMKAQNSIGKSDSSQIVTFKTQEEMPGGPPLDVSVEPLSSNSLKMKWRPPDHYLQFGQIKGYYIGYRIISNDVTSISSSTNSRRVQSIDSLSMNEQYAYKNVEANLVETSMNNGAYEIAYLTNLKKHTLYSIVVQAFNTAGAGPRSDEITVRTLNIQKSNTIVLEVLNTDIDSITLHWEIDDYSSSSSSSSTSSSTLANGNDFILHISEEGSAGKWIEKKLPGQLRRHVETNLKCGTKYLLYMTYVSSQQQQQQSTATGEIITTRTKGTVAISPSLDEFIAVNDTAITMNLDSWHDGGCPIQNFTIKYRQHRHKHWKNIGTIRYDPLHHHHHHQQQQPHRSSTFTINNLESDQIYILSVIAASTAGMTEAIYNFTTSNTSLSSSTMIFRLSPPDLASFEYQANAPFHNVTIMLPIIISVIVLVAVLTTLIAFMRKQELLRHERECMTQPSQNLHLRSPSIRSKDDLTAATEMIAYPMVDYHTLCSTPKNKAQEAAVVSQTTTAAIQQPFDDIYNSKSSMIHHHHHHHPTSTLMHYSPSINSKHTIICGENNNNNNPRSTTHVTINNGIVGGGSIGNHHIYAEPNGAIIGHHPLSSSGLPSQQQQPPPQSSLSLSSSTYAQPRLIMAATDMISTATNHNQQQQHDPSSSLLDQSSMISTATLIVSQQGPNNNSQSMNDQFNCALLNHNSNNNINNTHL
ncbi:cell adhesion molecule-like protein 12 [Dermatophagoides farinae]|uniref:Cell adhesion molecule-like protein 12 n=1 Tax=Dermatophagoides farinae TaxID=6954 RepID=A0A9D4SIM1_DERFA|nr:cell adhesion molecule-like protein 12 [Dermatophagoides farinae]